MEILFFRNSKKKTGTRYRGYIIRQMSGIYILLILSSISVKADSFFCLTSNMETHKRILGILYIVSGSLHILLMLFLSALFSILLPFIFEHEQVDQQWIVVYIIPFIQIITIITVLLFAIPSIIGGIALLNKKKWALTLVLVLGCFKLFSFPIGTALGIYSIWVYSEDSKHRASNPAT